MPTSEYDLTKGYLQQRYRESQRALWLAQISNGAPARPASVGLLDLMALKAGEFLVFYGLKLKEHYWSATGRPRHFFILDLGAD